MTDHEVRTFGSDVGDDDDSPGIALELTSDDIDDIAFSPEVSVEDRLHRLNTLADELRARDAGDLNGDMRDLLKVVKDRIRILKSDPVEGDATLDAAGMDTSDRMDDDDPADYDEEEINEDDLELKQL